MIECALVLSEVAESASSIGSVANSASALSEVAEFAKTTENLGNKFGISKVDFDKPFEKIDTKGKGNLYPDVGKSDFDNSIEMRQHRDGSDSPFDNPFEQPFEDGDVITWNGDGYIESYESQEEAIESQIDDPKVLNMGKPNSEVDSSKVDDNGKVYKDENGERMPNTEYTVNGTTYHTDELCRITDWKGDLKDTPENGRDEGAQVESGGKDRKEGDDGGHLQGRQNGGAPGNENLVPMRDTVNRGDYLKTENEENQMLKDGKTVTESGEVSYEGDSTRPSKIHKEYSDGEKTVKADFDNDAGSQDLLDKLERDISDEDLQSLKDEIADMEEDGNEVSVTSIKKDYDFEGNLKSTTVGVRNETTGEKYYRTFTNN